MSKPRISIVMATLNSVKFINSAIDSVIRQNYDKWELIVMDGGSTDGTIEVVKNYKHPNIYLFSEHDHGSYEAFLKGFDRARGDYLMCLTSSDGYLDEDWLRLCVDVLDSDSEVSLVWGIPAYCTEDGIVGEPHISFAQFLKRRTLFSRIWRIVKSKYRNQKTEKLIIKLLKIAMEGLPRSLFSSVITIIIRNLVKLGFEDIQKQYWFDFWLDSAICFPDGNMCFRRNIYDKCMPKFIQGNPSQDDFPQFYFNFNQMGFLSLCIPTIANFGRTHTGQISELFRTERLQEAKKYLSRVGNYADEVRSGREIHLFRNGLGKVIGQW
jgi:glycosyltransferase involved in cell wall biosynthesis